MVVPSRTRACGWYAADHRRRGSGCAMLVVPRRAPSRPRADRGCTAPRRPRPLSVSSRERPHPRLRPWSATAPAWPLRPRLLAEQSVEGTCCPGEGAAMGGGRPRRGEALPCVTAREPRGYVSYLSFGSAPVGRLLTGARPDVVVRASSDDGAASRGVRDAPCAHCPLRGRCLDCIRRGSAGRCRALSPPWNPSRPAAAHRGLGGVSC